MGNLEQIQSKMAFTHGRIWRFRGLSRGISESDPDPMTVSEGKECYNSSYTCANEMIALRMTTQQYWGMKNQYVSRFNLM
jgi:hypothetical protein